MKNKSDLIKISLCFATYLAIIALSYYLGYRIAEKYIGVDNSVAGFIIMGFALGGAFAWCLLARPFFRLKKLDPDDMMGGVNIKLFLSLGVGFFIVFCGIGFLICYLIRLPLLDGLIIFGSGFIGFLSFMTIFFPYMQDENEIINKNSDTYKMKRKEVKWRNIRDGILVAYGCVTLGGFVYAIEKASRTENFNLSQDPVVIGCLVAFLLMFIVFPITHGKLYGIKKHKFDQKAVIGEGVVHSCRQIKVEDGQVYGRHLKQTYEVLIQVPGKDSFLRAVSVEKFYKKGEKVKVEYDFDKPKFCNIVQSETEKEYIDKNIEGAKKRAQKNAITKPNANTQLLEGRESRGLGFLIVGSLWTAFVAFALIWGLTGNMDMGWNVIILLIFFLLIGFTILGSYINQKIPEIIFKANVNRVLENGLITIGIIEDVKWAKSFDNTLHKRVRVHIDYSFIDDIGTVRKATGQFYVEMSSRQNYPDFILGQDIKVLFDKDNSFLLKD